MLSLMKREQALDVDNISVQVPVGSQCLNTKILIFTSILGSLVFIYPSTFQKVNNVTLSVIQFAKLSVESVFTGNFSYNRATLQSVQLKL